MRESFKAAFSQKRFSERNFFTLIKPKLDQEREKLIFNLLSLKIY